VFVTNNATRTPADVVAHLATAGVRARPNEVVTSAVATASMLVSRGTRTALVVGEAALRSALTAAGIEVVDDGSTGSPDVVVVGLDRTATYGSLRGAAFAVERGAGLVATNADGSFPVPGGLAPGAGALLAAIEATTGVRGEVVGKPHPVLLQAARDRADEEGAHPVLVVGDRLDTDVAGAAGLGWDSLLVLTGVTAPEDIGASGFRPTYVGGDLTALLADPEPAQHA
jgi:HAD superfamily hydrolase (TIGR01450 family)